MKRYVLIIGVILLSLAAQAQSVTYTCRYWFDQNHEQATTTDFSTSTWQAEIDVGDLDEGIHSLHIHVMDTSLHWSAPMNYLFFKVPETSTTALEYRYWFDQDHTSMQSGFLGSGHLLLDVANLDEGIHSLHVMLKGDEYSTSNSYLFMKTNSGMAGTTNYVYHCWFDQDFTTLQTDFMGDGNLLLNVADLEEGMHTVNIMLEENSLSATQSYLFVKVASFSIDTADMSHLAYHCWFDQDFEHHQTDSLGDGHILLDVNDLEEGLHTVNVMVENGSGVLTHPKSYMFLKVGMQDPSSELQYRCWFDQDYSTVQTGFVGAGVFELEVSDLPNGFHMVNVQVANSLFATPKSYMFYKRPVGGCITKWEYWLNGDIDNRNITEMAPFTDTLEIITLLPVETWPIRSSCFHFHPDGEEPYINAKNEITFRFWTVDNRFIDKSAYYVDEQVQQNIVALVFERNTTETFAAPRDNQITWYKLEAGVGDSLAFVADKACTMQLFAPSGEEVLNVSGSESVGLRGLHAWEDGTYYLAVHDVTGSGETVAVTYQYVHKYAVLAYDVHLVGNGGCSTITFQGNGFNSLLDAYLVNYQNDTIGRLDIGHESNTTTTVTFNFYEVNLGVYDAVFQFYDETIRINGALEVQEPVDIVLTSTVSYPSQFLRNTACTYTYTITNEGNMTAYGVPIYVYISTETKYGISCIDIKEFDLPSYYDYTKDLYEWSDAELRNLKEYSDYIGYDHYFVQSIDIDDNGLDSVLIRSGNFYLIIPPYETRTITLSITSSIALETWISCPGEWLPIIDNQSQTRFANNVMEGNRLSQTDFCCWHNDVEDICNNLANTLSTFSTGVGILAAATYGSGLALAIAGIIVPNPVTTPILEGCAAILELEAAQLAALAAATGYVSCLSSALASISAQVANSMCNGNMTFADGAVSWGGTALSCASAVIGHLKPALVGDKLMMAMHATGVAAGSYSMAHNEKNPECTDEPPKGGQSTPVNSLDPNDIHGYLSESGSHYMRQEIQNVQYEIEFENDTTLATAAAHTIIVRDTLDATKFDLNSLAARSVTIGDKRLELNGEQTFARTLDLRPEIYVIAQVEQEYDAATGIVQWTIQSLDPMTMEPTDNPNQGVLPVNYNGNGVGFIDYSIDLKEAFADGTEISNRAGIIFDQEDQILTPTWTNIVDAVKPVSHIESAVPVADSLSFSFVSSDNRSGVWYHTLYYRNDSTAQEWQVRKAQIFEDSFMLKLDDLQTTEYLVMAIDSAGNREDKLMNAEYVFSLDSIVYYNLAVESQGCGEVSGAGTYLAGSHVVIEAIPDEGCQFEQWNDGVTENPRTVELMQDTTFVAYFSLDPTGFTQTTNLTSGWNWWSTYVEADDLFDQLATGLGANASQIKSSTSFVNYFSGLWIGGLNSINNESCYLINASNACTFEMTGSPATPANHPITINPNWNWIGYPNTGTMTVANAFSNFSPANGDQVKSMNAFATYYNGMWVGGLSTITPGMGLLYKSNSTGAMTLIYPEPNRSEELTENVTNENNHWTTDCHAYPSNMTVMAVVELDDEELHGENYELAAFANGECRGSARLMFVEPLDRYVAFLTIVGDEASELRFSLYDSETGVVETQDVASLQYETNATIGSLETPHVIRFRSTTGVDEWANNVNIFPNPVNCGEQFSLGLPAVETLRATSVQIINALGVVVETLHATSVPAHITAPKVAGVYTLKISVEGKGTCYRKLVVK